MVVLVAVVVPANLVQTHATWGATMNDMRTGASDCLDIGATIVRCSVSDCFLSLEGGCRHPTFQCSQKRFNRVLWLSTHRVSQKNIKKHLFARRGVFCSSKEQHIAWIYLVYGFVSVRVCVCVCLVPMHQCHSITPS